MFKITSTRLFYLFLAAFGLLISFDALETDGLPYFFIRLTVTLVALAFFSMTFMNKAATSLASLTFGLGLVSCGFGFYAIGQLGGLVAGLSGFIFIGVFLGRLHNALEPG